MVTLTYKQVRVQCVESAPGTCICHTWYIHAGILLLHHVHVFLQQLQQQIQRVLGTSYSSEVGVIVVDRLVGTHLHVCATPPSSSHALCFPASPFSVVLLFVRDDSNLDMNLSVRPPSEVFLTRNCAISASLITYR